MLNSWQNHSQCAISYSFDEEKVTLSVRPPSAGGEGGESARPLGAHLGAWTPQMSKDITGAGADKWLSLDSREGMDTSGEAFVSVPRNANVDQNTNLSSLANTVLAS